jgi:hypothetical protein
MSENIGVQKSNPFGSVGELTPYEHIAQFYDDDDALIETLGQYIGSTLTAGDSAIIIATEVHLQALERRLHESGVDVVSALIQNRYIALQADKTLRRFMVEQWVDEKRFCNFVAEVTTRARGNGRRIRAFWGNGRAALGKGRCCRNNSVGTVVEHPMQG